MSLKNYSLQTLKKSFNYLGLVSDIGIITGDPDVAFDPTSAKKPLVYNLKF